MISNRKTGIFLIIFGLIFISVSVFIIKSDEAIMLRMDSNTYSVKTEFNIKRGENSLMYNPKYTYIVNEKYYVCVSNYSSNIRPSDEPRKIFYNSQKPQDCFIEKGVLENAFLMIFTIIPSLIILAGIATFLGLFNDKQNGIHISSQQRPIRRRIR